MQVYLYGMTQLPLASGEADERRILGQVFAGSGEKQCYEQRTNVGGSGAGYYFGEECWRQLGPTSIDVDGKQVSVTAIARSYDGLAGNNYAGDWTYFYDPATHLIIRADTTNRRGAIVFGWTRKVL